MSFSFRLKHKHNVDLIISGFIRIHSNIENFPTDIQQLCTLMYFEEVDVWDASKSHNEFKFDTDANIVSRATSGYCRNAFGSMVIKKGNIKRWKLKLLDIDPSIFIGIVDPESKPNINGGFFNQNNTFALSTHSGMKYGNGQPLTIYSNKCKQNDIITMTLDMTRIYRGSLSFTINDNEYEQAFNTINVDKEYIMAISIHNPETVQLLQ